MTLGQLSSLMGSSSSADVLLQVQPLSLLLLLCAVNDT
jgi:hypothetical protein